MLVFEYDHGKNRLNKERHGVSLDDAKAMWDSTHVVIPAKNVLGEDRFAIVGQVRGKIYVAIFTERKESVRLISCHRADGRLVRIYEKYI